MGLPKIIRAIAALAIAVSSATIAPAAQTISADSAKINKLIIKRDYKTALAALTALANSGDAVAQYRLGALYSIGLGTKRNEEAARSWFIKSADAGNAKAALVLKRMAVNAPETPKKLSAVDNANAITDGAMFAVNELPPRVDGQPDWLTLASARNNGAAVKEILKVFGDTISESSKGAAVRIAALTTSRDALATLLAAGINVNQPDLRRLTPLMLAVETGSADLVRAVLQGKPNVNARDQHGRTSIALAARNCQPAIIQMLLEAGAEFTSEGDEEPPLVSTVKYCSKWSPYSRFMVFADINSFDRQGRSAAWYAAKTGNTPALQTVVEAGAKLDLPDKDGFTPVHAAAANGQYAAIAYVVSLADRELPIASNGTTALMLAANAGCLECASTLLTRTKDINFKNYAGDTALMYAVRGGRVDLARILLASDANPYARNANGDTPLKLAKRLKMQDLNTLK